MGDVAWQADDKRAASDEAAEKAAEAKTRRQAAQEAAQSRVDANEAANNALEEALKAKGVSSQALLRDLFHGTVLSRSDVCLLMHWVRS
jgi:hypothetical protein